MMAIGCPVAGLMVSNTLPLSELTNSLLINICTTYKLLKLLQFAVHTVLESP
jgi:hypothetical protein